MATKTVLFIHGLFVTLRSWDKWVSYYESKGYNVIAVAYPRRDKSPQELRRAHPDAQLGELAIDEVLEHHIRIINSLSEKPILIGHSFGGLLTQLLVNRGLAAAGVAVDSVPPQGVLSLEWSFLKAGFPLLNPLNSSAVPYMIPFEGFQYAFLNGMPLEEQKQVYEEYAVPESLRLGRGALSGKAKIDFSKPHAPLLIIGGEKDHIIPASLSRSVYQRYAGTSSVTEYKEFAGRNHFGIGADGWQEMADYVLEWLKKNSV